MAVASTGRGACRSAGGGAHPFQVREETVWLVLGAGLTIILGAGLTIGNGVAQHGHPQLGCVLAPELRRHAAHDGEVARRSQPTGVCMMPQ
eukprot:COSAG01_NODE_5298_length_4352_cov_3.291089_4_plen_91_part_00